jgi:hypothetical protein
MREVSRPRERARRHIGWHGGSRRGRERISREGCGITAPPAWLIGDRLITEGLGRADSIGRCIGSSQSAASLPTASLQSHVVGAMYLGNRFACRRVYTVTSGFRSPLFR